MNLARHATVLWRYRTVTAAGIGFAIIFAILASYQVRSSGLTPRSSESWSATSSILVTQPGFPEGRVTLPQQEVGDGVTAAGQEAVPEASKPKDQLEFADPARLASLGDLYAKFLTSDEVLSRVPERPKPAQVMASPFASSTGSVLLPVVELKTLATTGALARRININTFEALRGYLDERQTANKIATARRVDLKLLVKPKVVLESGVKPTASVLAFFLVLLGTLAFTHLLEALRTRRQRAALEAIVSFEPDDPRDDDEPPSVTRGSEQRATAAGHRLRR
jgi:hypothetical protein